MADFTSVRLPQLAWFGDTDFDIRLPPSWEVTVCYMKGYNRQRLSEAEIQAAFAGPLGCPPIRELAQGKKEVVIAFDDLTRPTRAAELLPYLLAELEEAGVPEEGIRFIAALGAHGALNRADFAKKLGEAVLDRFPVYNHNPYENLTFLGNTSRGTPLWVNTEFVTCDLRIGVGCILPHTIAGFSGGGKIVLPGVSSMDTIHANHCMGNEAPDTVGMGKIEANELQLDMAEAAAIAGLDVKIDAVVNARRETVGLFVGQPQAAHAAGVKLAEEVYATERADGADIVIANLYAKADEAGLFLGPSSRLLEENGGDLVMLANTPAGQVTHYLLRSFGKYTGGRLWQERRSLPRRVKRLILLSPYGDRAAADWLGPPQSIIWARTWEQVLEELRKVHKDGARVTVIPDASMQYFPPQEVRP